MLVGKALSAVVSALEKRFAGKPRGVLDVGARSTTTGDQAFLGNLLNRAFDGDLGNAIQLTELNDGRQFVARFKGAILDAATNIRSY